MSPPDAATTTIPTEAEVRTWFETLSNWGRWGTDDLRGTLNHITAAKRAAAAGSVTAGETVSCAWDVAMSQSQMTGARVPPQRWMVGTGLGLGDEPPPTGPRTSDDGCFAGAMEFISMVFHGRAITHLDALSHIFWEGKMYGGLPSSYVTDRDGASVHDIRSVHTGIQTRGVLLDIARSRGVEWLAPGEPVYPADLEAAEATAGVKVEPGDVLLLRTGDGRRRANDPAWNPHDGQPGYHAACLPWLAERGVAAIGSDGIQDVYPSGYPGLTLPVHTVGIVAMGLWLIDNCQLEDLADACLRHGRSAFFFTLAPMRLQGVTGSPANPLALF